MTAFAAEMDLDPDAIVSASVEIEWPYGSGRRLTVPEIDAVRWVTLPVARQLMLKSQHPFLDRLEALRDGTDAGLPSL